MGKAATTTRATAKTKTAAVAAEVVKMKRKKKKGRLSVSDPQKKRAEKTPTPPSSNFNPTSSRRSTRRNPSNYNSGSSDFINEDYDDDDDERKEKKVKLVVRLPQSNQQHLQHSSSQNSGSSSDSKANEDEDHEGSSKKRRINAANRRSNDGVFDQGGKASKATDTLSGSPLESGPTTPLPDKKLLLFILDRLQKKDTYGVFSEPVDPNELPEYHKIIERPMDFGTVRKKLDGGSYLNLEELEADVFLICSNAMQFNAPDTIYFRQARSIQELAQRDFENLRHEGDDGEPQPKVVRRGRPPSKNLKKPLESSPVDRAGLELSSGATLASGEDKAIGSNAYNLRKGPMLYRFRSNDGFATSHHSRNGEPYSEWLVDWNSEFPASILKADMKYGKKQFSVDENRRDTYKQFHPSVSSMEQSYLSDTSADTKRLMAVGLHLEPHAYARSLARYSANLGPVACKIALKKLKSAVPDGIAFGPGWVGENEAPPQPSSFPVEKQKPANGLVCDRDSNRAVSSAIVYRPSEEMVEAVQRLNCQNDLAERGGSLSWAIPGSSLQAQQKSVLLPNRNGFNSMLGYDQSSQVGVSKLTTAAVQSRLEKGSTSYQIPGVSTSDLSSIHPGFSYQASSEEIKMLENWVASPGGHLLVQAPNSRIEHEVGSSSKSSQRVLAVQHRQPLAVPPDLNVRIQTSGSPSSSLQIGSPQQPDLALQL